MRKQCETEKIRSLFRARECVCAPASAPLPPALLRPLRAQALLLLPPHHGDPHGGRVALPDCGVDVSRGPGAKKHWARQASRAPRSCLSVPPLHARVWVELARARALGSGGGGRRAVFFSRRPHPSRSKRASNASRPLHPSTHHTHSHTHTHTDSDELKNEDVSLRLNSVRRLSTIAAALGEERARAELIPFLVDAQDDEDEVLLAMAEELAKLVPLVGGPRHAHALLPPLEALAAVEETVVRDAAVAGIKRVAADMDDAAVEAHVAPLVARLARGAWFTARVSACGLLASAHARARTDAARAEVRALFASLARDETPMVRRAAAGALAGVAAEAGPAAARADLVPAFLDLAADDQDSVRLLAVGACAPLARLLKAGGGGGEDGGRDCFTFRARVCARRFLARALQRRRPAARHGGRPG